MISKINTNEQKTKTSVTVECTSVTESLNNISENLASSIKGKFGNQVRKELKTQAEKMNELK